MLPNEVALWQGLAYCYDWHRCYPEDQTEECKMLADDYIDFYWNKQRLEERQWLNVKSANMRYGMTQNILAHMDAESIVLFQIVNLAMMRKIARILKNICLRCRKDGEM